MEGKEARFGDTSSAFYEITSTQTSTGSVDSANDSYTPMGGFARVDGDDARGGQSRWGVGSGLYTILAVRHHHRVHRRFDGGSNAGVSGEERYRPGR
jgi:K+-transporting ATPase ATPase A chain